MAQSRNLGDIADTLFGASNTNIAFDSDTLYIDSVNNKVGFGTTTPTQKVDIVGSANVSGTLTANSVSVAGNTTSGNVSTSSLRANSVSVAGNTTSGNVSTSSLSLSGTIPNLVGAKIKNLFELATISPIAANGTINFDILTQSVLYYTANSTANVIINLRGSDTTP